MLITISSPKKTASWLSMYVCAGSSERSVATCSWRLLQLCHRWHSDSGGPHAPHCQADIQVSDSHSHQRLSGLVSRHLPGEGEIWGWNSVFYGQILPLTHKLAVCSYPAAWRRGNMRLEFCFLWSNLTIDSQTGSLQLPSCLEKGKYEAPTLFSMVKSYHWLTDWQSAATQLPGEGEIWGPNPVFYGQIFLLTHKLAVCSYPAAWRRGNRRLKPCFLWSNHTVDLYYKLAVSSYSAAWRRGNMRPKPCFLWSYHIIDL